MIHENDLQKYHTIFLSGESKIEDVDIDVELALEKQLDPEV